MVAHHDLLPRAYRRLNLNRNANILEIRSDNPLAKIIARLNQLSTTSVLESTKVIVEQVSENHYEFWVTRKGFGVFSNLYDLVGQLIVEENNQVLIQTQT